MELTIAHILVNKSHVHVHSHINVVCYSKPRLAAQYSLPRVELHGIPITPSSPFHCHIPISTHKNGTPFLLLITLLLIFRSFFASLCIAQFQLQPHSTCRPTPARKFPVSPPAPAPPSSRPPPVPSKDSAPSTRSTIIFARNYISAPS